MELALGHPTLGYYQRHDPLGVAGDFVTAPEISQMFGEIVGLWLGQAWSDLGRPAPVRLVELGPGRGTLMADLLRASARVEGFRAALSVHLVERSAGCAGCRPSPGGHRRRVARGVRSGAAGPAPPGRQRVPRRAAGPPAGADRARLGRAPHRARRRSPPGLRAGRAALALGRSGPGARRGPRHGRRGRPGARRARASRSRRGSPARAGSRC